MAAKKGPKVFGKPLPLKVNRLAIGIDQSYSGFGVTLMDMDSDAYYTTVFKGEGIGIDRLLDIQEKLWAIIEDATPASSEVIVGMEGYAFGSQMANMAGELGAVVKLTLHDLLHKYHGKYPYIIPPTVLKKYVTGKGNGVQKNQILLSVYKKWGVEFTDDNAADSYALAHMVAGKCDLAYEREIYHNIQDPKYREK
jgi:crossover junction endodeoxyribonuclease RuvC